MKTHTIASCAAALVLGTVASLRAETPSGAPASPETAPPDVVRRFDANVNGKLDPEERAKWQAEEEKNAKAKADRLAKKEQEEAKKKKKKKQND